MKTECVGLVSFLEHIYDKMPKLLEQYSDLAKKSIKF